MSGHGIELNPKVNRARVACRNMPAFLRPLLSTYITIAEYSGTITIAISILSPPWHSILDPDMYTGYPKVLIYPRVLPPSNAKP